jgi:hypothetical protein
MARIRPQVNPNNPIPNNPFYSPESNYISGVSGPFIVGSGLTVNNITGTINSSGGGGGGAVSKIIAAAGISVNPVGGTGNVTVSNTGVLSLIAGSGVSVSASTGNITISSTSAASVSNVIGVAPISVANGTTTPSISIATATTTNSGVTTLVNNLTTDDNTKALTAAQGKSLQDQITALTASGTIELAGTIDAATGLVASVTSVGSSEGYAVGSTLPISSSTTNNSYVIVTTPGTLTPPGGTPTAATRGDWFLVSEITPGNYQWTFLNVGFDAPPATTTIPGIVELSTNAEAQAGTDATTAITPAAAAATYVPLSTFTAKGTLIAGQAVNSPVALPVGSVGQVLQVDPTTTSGLKWVTPPATCTGTVTQVGSGAGLTGGPITTVGSLDLVVQGISAGSYTNPSLTVNCYGVVTGISNGVAGIPCSCITAKGDLIVGASANTPVPLGVGSNGQVLTACSTAPNGVCWAVVPVATPTSQGTVLGRVDLGSGGLGFRALNSLTTGVYNVGIGEDAGCSITSGCRNVAVGPLALCSVTTVNDNVGIGVEALRRNTSGCANIAIGTTTLVFNTTGISNVAIGCDSGRANNGSGNVFVGTAAGQSGTGVGRSVAIGEFSLQNGGTAQYSTAVGWNALNTASGGCNTAIGAAAGTTITTGTYNLAIGPNVQVASGTASCQLAIGWETNRWLTGDSGKHIQPGAGIRDCTGSLGTSGQVLTTTGAAIQWASVANPIQRSSIPAFAFPNGATTVITFAPDTNNGRAVQFWVTGVKTNDGRAQLRTGTWIRDFGNNIYDIPWGSGTGGLLGLEDPGSGTAGIRIRNNSGVNMNVNVAWLPIWS